MVFYKFRGILKSMKKEHIAVAVLFLIIGLSFGYLLSSNQLGINKGEEIATSKPEGEEGEEEKIGGERDERGCLVVAGYEYDEEIGACIRDWELNENQKEGAVIAVDYLDDEGATVVEVLESSVSGTYRVVLETAEGQRVTVDIADGEVVEVDGEVVGEAETEVDYGEIAVQVEKALREKHGWELEEMEVEVSWSDGEWAEGGVSPTEGRIGGAMWFAGKVDDEWEIIWDGNGTVMCEDVDSFAKQVPTSLIEECYEEGSGMIER